MRLAVWHNLPSGGGKRAFHGQVAGLIQRGHEVEAWCPTMADGRYLPLSKLCPEHVLPLELPPEKNLMGFGAIDVHQGADRAVAALGVDFSVRVMVPDAELIPLLGRAAAVLYTSRLEPFGLAPLEANACGTPVLAIAEGGVRESIIEGENGLLMPDASPGNMAAVIERFFTEPGLAEALRKKSRAAGLARWRREAGIDRIEKVLTNLVAEKKRNA